MSEVRSTAARRKASKGLVSVRIGATKIGGKPAAFWVPLATAEKMKRLAETEAEAAAKRQAARKE